MSTETTELSADEARLNELNTRITREFEQFLLFNTTLEVAKDLYAVMEEKAALEDKLGLIVSGQPQKPENLRMRQIVMTATKNFITSGNKGALLTEVMTSMMTRSRG